LWAKYLKRPELGTGEKKRCRLIREVKTKRSTKVDPWERGGSQGNQRLLTPNTDSKGGEICLKDQRGGKLNTRRLLTGSTSPGKIRGGGHENHEWQEVLGEKEEAITKSTIRGRTKPCPVTSTKKKSDARSAKETNKKNRRR